MFYVTVTTQHVSVPHRPLTCVQWQPALAVGDVVRRMRFLVGHWFVPLAHSDSGRPVLKREAVTFRDHWPRTSPRSCPHPQVPDPEAASPHAALTLKQTAEVCRARQMHGRSRLQDSIRGLSPPPQWSATILDVGAGQAKTWLKKETKKVKSKNWENKRWISKCKNGSPNAKKEGFK